MKRNELMQRLIKHTSYHEAEACLSEIEAALSIDLTAIVEGRAAADVLAERARQMSAEGWTPDHDDAHDKGEMAQAAAHYASFASLSDASRQSGLELGPGFGWPWDERWWKPTNRRRDLVKAGALIIAEIERLDRAMIAAKE